MKTGPVTTYDPRGQEFLSLFELHLRGIALGIARFADRSRAKKAGPSAHNANDTQDVVRCPERGAAQNRE